jgi:hypothetical protein
MLGVTVTIKYLPIFSVIIANNNCYYAFSVCLPVICMVPSHVH